MLFVKGHMKAEDDLKFQSIFLSSTRMSYMAFYG